MEENNMDKFSAYIVRLHMSGASWLDRTSLGHLSHRTGVFLGPKDLVALQNGPNTDPDAYWRGEHYEAAAEFFDKSYLSIVAENAGYEWDDTDNTWVPIQPSDII